MSNEIEEVETRTEIDKRIELLIDSMYPIIYISSWEEERLMRKLAIMASNMHKTIYSWSCSQGIQEGSPDRYGGSTGRDSAEPTQALDFLLSYKGGGRNQEGGAIFVFHDFHKFMPESGANPLIIRKLRDVAAHFRYSANPLKTLILISPVLAMPPELEKDITIIDYPLPDQQEIGHFFQEVLEEYGRKPGEIEPSVMEELMKAALGLTENESRNVFKKLIVHSFGKSGAKMEKEDVDFVAKEKEQTILKSGMLEYQSVFEGFDVVGGLDELKSWLRKRANSFTQRAREFGLPEPKGVLLIGVPGCGKSMCAKVISAEWHKPLLRFDIGKIFGKFVGQAEENMRRAIKVAESVSPCILWIDEIEKGFAGMQSGGDSGVTARVFGTLLTWMQEKTKPVFVVATANEIKQLPPELLRKGRFDEIFFVDLPSEEEREAIFKIHVDKLKGRSNFLEEQWDKLRFTDFAKQTDGFSGAEIEQVVVATLHDAFFEREEESREPVYNDLFLSNIKQTVPLSVTMKAIVTALRQWAETRARLASTTRAAPVKAKPAEGARQAPKLKIAFIFEKGQRALTLEQLLELCKEFPDEAKKYFANGQLEIWLQQNGLASLSKKVSELKQSPEQDYAFMEFLEEARGQTAPA